MIPSISIQIERDPPPGQVFESRRLWLATCVRLLRITYVAAFVCAHLVSALGSSWIITKTADPFPGRTALLLFLLFGAGHGLVSLVGLRPRRHAWPVMITFSIWVLVLIWAIDSHALSDNPGIWFLMFAVLPAWLPFFQSKMDSLHNWLVCLERRQRHTASLLVPFRSSMESALYRLEQAVEAYPVVRQYLKKVSAAGRPLFYIEYLKIVEYCKRHDGSC